MVFHIAKIVILFFKSIVSKPLANVVKQKAKKSPLVRKICIWPSQLYHSYDVRMKMKILGMDKPKRKVVELDVDRTVERGAELIGETFLYLFVCSFIYLEYYLTNQSNEAKEETKKAEMLAITRKLEELGLENQKQDTQIRSLERALLHISK